MQNYCYQNLFYAILEQFIINKPISLKELAVVIVTYNSDLLKLTRILSLVFGQVYVSDNSDSSIKRKEIHDLVTSFGYVYLDMHGNLGIAAAQNKAINLAFADGNSFALLLDDDSIPGHELEFHMLDAYSKISNKKVLLTARAIDKNGCDVSNACDNEKLYTPCNLLNSSGTLIPKSVYLAVGEFDESLFIDCVDFEWGWRAIKAGYELFLVSNAKIHHALGEGTVLNFRYGSPIRHYYQFRNILCLGFSGRSPATWFIPQFLKLILKPFAVLCLMDNKTRRLKYMAHGVFDAIQSKTGKYSRN